MMVAFAAAAVMLLLGWMLAGSALTAPSISLDQASIAKTDTIFSRYQASAVSPEANPRLPIAPVVASSGVQALQFQFSQGQLVMTHRETAAGGVRTPRHIGGKSGIYHRLVDAEGNVVFEGLTADPRVMHYDYTDDGRSLKGGVAVQQDTPFQIRLPAGLSGKLEIYLARSASVSPRTQATAANLLAQVSLP